MTCTNAKPECMSRVTFGDCSCLQVREETAREMETRFWSIVDADGLSGLPSDTWAALDQLARAKRNRDMWKAQCERQAAETENLRQALANLIVEQHGATLSRLHRPQGEAA